MSYKHKNGVKNRVKLKTIMVKKSRIYRAFLPFYVYQTNL